MILKFHENMHKHIVFVNNCFWSTKRLVKSKKVFVDNIWDNYVICVVPKHFLPLELYYTLRTTQINDDLNQEKSF